MVTPGTPSCSRAVRHSLPKLFGSRSVPAVEGRMTSCSPRWQTPPLAPNDFTHWRNPTTTECDRDKVDSRLSTGTRHSHWELMDNRRPRTAVRVSRIDELVLRVLTNRAVTRNSLRCLAALASPEGCRSAPTGATKVTKRAGCVAPGGLSATPRIRAKRPRIKAYSCSGGRLARDTGTKKNPTSCGNNSPSSKRKITVSSVMAKFL